MSHPMFYLSGTEAQHKFRGSLRGAGELQRSTASAKKSIAERAFRDSDGSYQSSRHARESAAHGAQVRVEQRQASAAAAVMTNRVRALGEHVRATAAHASVPPLKLLHQVSLLPVTSQIFKQAGPQSAREAAHLPAPPPARANESQRACDDSGVWDERKLEAKLDSIRTLQMQLLGKVGTSIPESAGGGDAAPRAAESKFDIVLPKLDAQHVQPPHAYVSQLPVLEQIDAVAVQVQRCVMEMRQRIVELAHMQAPIELPPSVADLTPQNGISNTAVHPEQQLPQPLVPPSRPRGFQPAALTASSPRTRVSGIRLGAASEQRGVALWDSVAQLHPCFVAVADGDWSHLLTVQHVKKDDVRLKGVSLRLWTAFLRHSKAYTKLGFTQHVGSRVFELALHTSGFALDEHRVNFYGFCQIALLKGVTLRLQVVFNLAASAGLLHVDNDWQSASGCTAAASAAVGRLLLLLVPQFATPGSRTARNCERNAWMASPLRSSLTAASAVSHARTREAGEDDWPTPSRGLHFAGQIEQRCASPAGAPAPADPTPTPGEMERTLPDASAPLHVKLSISCCDLLDCDVFSKSDPYAVVMRRVGATGQRGRDFEELGRTEVILDNLNPVFKTAVEFVSEVSDQELLVQLWDKDDSDDDFLGEASLLLGNLIADPKRTHTLPLAIPGKQHKLKSTVTLAAEIGCGAE